MLIMWTSNENEKKYFLIYCLYAPQGINVIIFEYADDVYQNVFVSIK